MRQAELALDTLRATTLPQSALTIRAHERAMERVAAASAAVETTMLLVSVAVVSLVLAQTVRTLLGKR